VHIVIPESSPFIDEKGASTASVVLTLDPYAKINQEKIKGIANFMAGAVPGLTPENVTVMDASWNILSDPAMFKNNGLGQTTQPNNQLELKRSLERELELRLQSMLERIFGFGKVVTRVSSELGFDFKETKAERYEPITGSKGIIRSEQQSKESQSGTSSQNPMGVAGITSNIPGYQITNDATDTSSFERSESIINYEVSKVSEHLVVAPGNISRLSVAVWLKVREAVTAAAGLDFSRGDQLTVESIPFAEAKEQAPQIPSSGVGDLKQTAYVAAGVLAFLIILVVYLRRRARKKKEDQAVLEMAAVSEEEHAQAQLLQKEDIEKGSLEREIKILARQKPEEIAKVLQSWLTDE